MFVNLSIQQALLWGGEGGQICVQIFFSSCSPRILWTRAEPELQFISEAGRWQQGPTPGL